VHYTRYRNGVQAAAANTSVSPSDGYRLTLIEIADEVCDD
jgi:hypothetical protein